MATSTKAFSSVAILFTMSVGYGYSQDNKYTLNESFAPGTQYSVSLKTEITGEITLPPTKTTPEKLASLTGNSSLVYTERVLTAADDGSLRVIRQYKDVAFKRTIAEREQQAFIRASVSRMVLMRNDAGAKVPFSPDGPLTWGEIDAIRTDIFTPIMVSGLLPQNPVKAGDSWPISKAALRDLSEMTTVEDSTLKVTFVSMVKVKDEPMARLTLGGTVKGTTEDGPSVQTLDATIYFNTKTNMLAYMSLKGTQELQDEKKKRVGKIYGNFTMTRNTVELRDTISDVSMKNIILTPTAENTLLLYENPELGVKFVHPRSWRLGAVQGKQLTLEHTRKSGAILITREELTKLPTTDGFLQEAKDQIKSLKGKVNAVEGPKDNRFGMDAEINGKNVKLDYAVVKGIEAGATFAARFPAAEAAELVKDFDRILKDFEVTRAKK